jgi:uncharacterized protein
MARRRKGKKQKISGILINALIAIAILFVYYIAIAGVLSGIMLALYHFGYLGYNDYYYLVDAAALLSLGFSVLLYLRTYKQLRGGRILSSLGLARSGLTLRNVGLGLVAFAIIICLELIVGLLSVATGVQINTNVQMVFAGAPLWFYAFTFLIEPLNEELVFRGFLVPRLGIVASALIFGLAHYSYDSTFGVEVIAAFIFGLITGYIYKKTGSIYPGVIAHMLVNALAVLSILSPMLI